MRGLLNWRLSPIPTSRAIHPVPALHVSELFRLGKLPSAPLDVIAAARVPERRDPTLAEFAALTWLLYGSLDAPYGVASYRDTYDYQSSSDVRETTHIAGSARACVELIRFLIADARAAGLCCIGVTDKSNAKMCSMLARLGCKAAQIRWESR
jgi:hypothetical protein